MTTVTMPAGKYYVGDLCYVMDKEWDEACDLFFAGRDDMGCNQGKFTLKDGRTFTSFNTQWGDGGYYDQYGHEYGVDSGGIGCILVDDLQERPTTEGQIVEFKREFECSREGGLLRFGHIVIDTNPSYEEEEEDYACEDD